jgi:hypothetical protein
MIAMATVTKRTPPKASGDTIKQGPATMVRHFFGKVGHFTLHFAEMCVVMCVGALGVNWLLFEGVGLISYNLRQAFPVAALLVVAFNFALLMAVWMRFRGMAWRPNLEMAGATLGLGIVLSGMYWLGIVTGSTLIEFQLMFCFPACVVMLVVMLFRLPLYTGSMRHHAHAA